MAEVTGMMLSRALAMEAATIVDGHIDGAGHLILTRHDGNEIDAGYSLVAIPDASTTVRGSVELATEAETAAHSDAVRAVTPASLASTFSRIATLETETKVTIIPTGTLSESSGAASYPVGVSLYDLTTGSGWSLNSGFGTLITEKISNNRCVQRWYTSTGGTQTPRAWFRTHHTSGGGGGWTAWGLVANSADPSSMGMTGEIKMWTVSTTPAGWILCDGEAHDRDTQAALFAVIGTTYGAGDGSTTFNVPNLKGRVPVGFDGSQSEFNTIGETGGENTHTLTSGEMPSHTHTQNPHTHLMQGNGALTDGSFGTSYVVNNGTFYGFRTDQPDNTTAVNQNTGGGGAHNNLQPYLTIRYIIKA